MSVVEKQHLIDLVDLTKVYDGETEALSHLNLYIRKKEFVTLLGPSGCGKTTTLRLVAGFEFPTTGQVYFEGKEITELPPYKRRVNTVFQKYALFPHMNVFENIAFGLRLKKVDEGEIQLRVGEMLEMVNLRGFGKRKVDTLSGGQQQRVAIARALANRPEVLLLDEPLSALDLKLRKEMQIELKAMQQQLGITFVYVTHDQEEALTMSDTIVVMKEGVVQQIGTPIDIYNEPKNAFVADFIGESNILPGIMLRDELVSFEGHDFLCVDQGFGENKPVDVVIRPEDVQLCAPGDGMLRGTVESIVFKGVHYEMMIHTGSFVFMVHSTLAKSPGEEVGLRVVPFDIHIMKKEAAR
ncbi:MAG: ABC transporter ATP-binding protein [Christensenellaceae bacterium]|jgi:spermidine/putrescine transport system ATP-binding protein|nr:ABC transporter ATP-binding protein [Christensenellaceae bacterium]